MSAPSPQWEPYAVTVKTAGQMVNRSKWVLYEEIKKGRLPAHRPNPRSDYLILTEDLKRWVQGEYADGYDLEAAS